MHITLRQLTLFRAAAQHLSFTRAAAELYLTQPAVSAQIKQLESHIGMPLFEQVGKRIFLTEAGQVLYNSCHELFAQLESLEKSLHELQRSVKGQLKVSVVTTATYFMPHLFSHFSRLYPEVNLRLNVANRTSILERLANNADDLVIMGQVPEQLHVEVYPFLQNPLVVIAPASHPLVGEEHLSLTRLAQERLLFREPGSGTRLAMERVFAAQGIEIPVNIELGNSEAIKQGVIAGLGLSVLSQHTLAQELAVGSLKLLNVEGFPLLRQWYAVHLSEKKLPLIARTFLDFLLTRAEEIFSSRLTQQ